MSSLERNLEPFKRNNSFRRSLPVNLFRKAYKSVKRGVMNTFNTKGQLSRSNNSVSNISAAGRVQNQEDTRRVLTAASTTDSPAPDEITYKNWYDTLAMISDTEGYTKIEAADAAWIDSLEVSENPQKYNRPPEKFLAFLNQ